MKVINRIMNILAVLFALCGVMFLISGDEYTTAAKVAKNASTSGVCWFLSVLLYIGAAKESKE